MPVQRPRSTSASGELPPLQSESVALTAGNRWQEAKKVFGLAAPSIVFLLSGFGVQTIAIVFIARIGQLQLSAAVLAASVFNTTGLSLVYGLAGGMDTLCGQAFGAQNYPMMGVILQRCVLVNAAVAIPIILLWSQMSPILIALGQSAEIAPLAAKYMLLSAPQMVLGIVTVALEKFQTAQNIMNAVTAVNLGVFMICPFFFWLFTHHLQWGLTGAAIANNTTSAFAMTCMAASTVWLQRNYYSREDGRRRAWSGFTWRAWQGWGEYLQLGLPACAMTCLEWWLYEVALMLSGLLPEPQMSLAVSGICNQIVSLAFMVPLGVSIALRIRVSNLLGAGQPKAAKRTITAGLLVTGTLLIPLLVMLLGFRSQFARWLLPYAALDSPQSRALQDCIAMVALGAIFDWVNTTLAGTLQGAGRQLLGAKIYGVTYWGVGAFLLWLIPFRLGWGVRGIWAALAIATTLQCGCMAVAVCRLDFHKEADNAQRRVGNDSVPPISEQGSDASIGSEQALLLAETQQKGL